MAKIWRRKVKGKEIGSYLVLVKGVRVNLETSNASVARKRAAAALAGKWPPSKARAGAESTAASLEVEAAPEVLADEIPSGGDVPAATVADPGSVREPPPPADEQAPRPAAGADAAGTSEADAIAAAAAAGGGDEEPPGFNAAGVADAEEEAKRAEWRARFEAMFGGGTSPGVSMGAGIAMGTLMAACGVGQRVAEKRGKKFAFEVSEGDWRLQCLAMGWDEQLRRWGLGLGQAEPWHAILAGTAALAIGVAMAVHAAPPIDPEAPKPEAKA